MKKITKIFVHHSASDWGNANEIRKWHKEKGWADIGYHFVILNGYTNYEDFKNNRKFDFLVGQIECGRYLNADEWLEANEVGAHVYGFNTDSIGICLIHNSSNYDQRMIGSLMNILFELVLKFNIPIENIKGHYEVEPNKPDCPSIDMDRIRMALKNRIKLGSNYINQQ